MDKVEKIVAGLKHCAEDNCRGCPYQNTTSDCLGDLHRDALAYILEVSA